MERAQEERYVNGLPESQEMIWNGMKEIIVPAAAEVCGRTCGRQQQERESWWWKQEIQTAIKEKGIARRKWEEENNSETREEYRQKKGS